MKVELVQAVCGNNEATGAVILDRFMPSGGAGQQHPSHLAWLGVGA